MKALCTAAAVLLVGLSCRASADIVIVNRIVIDEKTLLKLLSKPRPEPKQKKIKVEERFLNCDLGDRIAWALLTNHSVNTTK